MSTVQEKKINTFHQQCLRRILRIRWQHKITNKEVLRRTGLTTLSQRRLGHVLRMSNEHIPKSLLHSEVAVKTTFASATWQAWMLILRRLTDDRNKWRSLIRERLRERENKRLGRPKKRLKEPEWFIYFVVITVCCLCFLFSDKFCGYVTYGRFRLIAGHHLLLFFGINTETLFKLFFYTS